MKRIRVLHCLETVGSGGVEQTRLSLARKLDPERFEQRLVCTQALGGLPALIEGAGCPIHQVGVFNGIYDPRPYRKTFEAVRRYRPHIIHGAVFEGVAQAAVVGRASRTPIIVGEETSDPQNRRWTGSVLFRAFAGLCHHMIGVSPAVVAYLEKTIRIPSRDVTLVNNGVAEKLLSGEADVQALRDRLGLKDGAFVIGTVGRLFDEHKRTSDLIRALKHVVSACPAAHLVIVGDGPDATWLRELAIQENVGDHVSFAGYAADPQPYYQLMDVFVLSSAHEAFGLVLVEAMFNQVPVVATRVGGVPSVVDDGVTGHLVPPCEPHALAGSILDLYRNPQARRAMGIRARQRALENFSEERYVADVAAVYERLLSARGIS